MSLAKTTCWLVILTAAIAVTNIILICYTVKSNDRAARVFVAENRPLIDVTPVGVQKDGAHVSTLFTVANYRGFTAYEIGLDIKYGDYPWMSEYIKAAADNKGKEKEGVVEKHIYLSPPATPTSIGLEELRPGQTISIAGKELDALGYSGTLDLEKEVTTKGDKGLTVAIRATWKNKKKGGHVFDIVYQYQLIGTRVDKGRSFTFIPKGIVS